MTVKDTNKQRIRMLFEEVLNRGRVGLLDNLISGDYIDHNPVPGQGPGAEGIRNKLKGLREAFPDIRFLLEDLVAENDLVAARYHWKATQTGPFMGLPPRGTR
jgi:predicted ester cyclase